MRRVTVALTPPYDVVVGDGALAEVASVVGDRRKVAVVSQAGVADFHAPALDRRAPRDGRGDRRVPHGRR